MPQSLFATPIVRMSGDRQQNSPERQREAFAAYCQRHNLIPCGEYADLAVSASKTKLLDRPAIQRLLADAPTAKWTVVWFEEISRAARKGEEAVYLDTALRAENKFLVGPDDDPRQMMDGHFRKLMLFLGGWKAEDETNRMGIRIADTQRMIVAHGRYRGGYLPPGLGWQWDDREARQGHYILDTESQPLAVRAFQLFIETRCYQQVAKQLTSEGFTSRQGNPLSQPAAARIIQNQTYRGSRRFGGETYPTDLPQIVPPELVAQADTILRQQARRPLRSTHDYTSRAIFAGLLRCPSCGGWLQVHYNINKQGRAYLAYKCHRARTLPITCDWRTMVPELTFEREILPVLQARLRQEARRIGRGSESGRQQAHVKRQRERLHDERERVLRQHQQGWIDDEEVAARLEEIRARLEGLAGETAVDAPVSAEKLRTVLQIISRTWQILSPPEKRSLLQAVIEHITPTPPNWPDALIEWR